MNRLIACLVALCLPALAAAQDLPAAIYTDPPADAAHPAGMQVLHIPSGGATINAVAYTPAGAGPHPVFVFFHGLPGNEKNLDLVQAVRRAGWVAIAPNYRGSWGSGGSFGFRNCLDDAAAVLAWLREPAMMKAIGGDPRRIVIAGHSMGGWVTAHTAASHPELAGAVLISAADMGATGARGPRAATVAMMADNMETLAGTSPDKMADELIVHAHDFGFAPLPAKLVGTRLLVLSSDDGLAPGTDALVSSIRAAGGTNAATQHEATDHGWSGKRIALQKAVIDWLATLP